MKRILVVDDQPNIRLLVKIGLRGENREILEAESGERAIEIARMEKLDLIIMDLIMPGGMHGLDAVEILRSDPQTRNCPVLIITARDQKSERERAREIGVADYLPKPFRLDVLQKKVERMLT